MSILSMLLSAGGAALAWFAIGPGWLPLVIVGVAAALAFVQTIAALRAGNWGHWSLRALVVALVVLIALPAIERYRPMRSAVVAVDGGTALALPPVTDTSAAPGGLPVLSNDPPPAPKEEPTVLQARTAALVKKVNRVAFDMDARAAALGAGVDGPYNYVRDAIGFDPYPGVLRGDRGTYLARAGNAWDRALLLSSLLRAKGYRTRFASAHIDEAAAAQLYDRAFERPAARSAVAPPTPNSKPFSDRIRVRATRDLAIVRAALGSAPAEPAGLSRADVIEELRDHAWVQADVNGVWRDMDPSLKATPAGRALAPAAQTFDEIPEERWQRVTFAVEAEWLNDGALSMERKLEWSGRAADLLGKKIFVTHVPAATGATNALARMAGQQWRPVVWVDGNVNPGEPIAFQKVDDNSAGGFFFGGGGGSGTLVAEWLQLDFDLTGGKTASTRRALFDRAASIQRNGDLKAEALPPMPMTNMGPAPALALHNVWLTAGGHDLASYADRIAKLSAEPAPSGPDVPAEAQLERVALANYPFVIWSEHLILPSINDSAEVRAYADSPRAMIFSLTPNAGGPGRLDAEMDLRRDTVRAIARQPGMVRAAFDRKVWFGVLEGALEHELTVLQVAGGSAADYLTTSALVSDRGAVLVTDSAAADVAALAGTPVRAERMQAAVANGSRLIVPRPPSGKPARGWWDVSAAGDTRAVTDGDLGGSSSALGKGLGSVRNASGAGLPPNEQLRIPRAPAGGGGNEYLTLLQVIGLLMIYALEYFIYDIQMRAIEGATTVMEELPVDSEPSP
jgi:transglutaminase-like putative cysteine protease